MSEEMRLIDANDLIAQFDDSFKGFVMKKIIEAQPTVDAVPVVHGRWEKSNMKYRFCCSVCCCAMPIRTNFCPYCGAKMDGGNENEAR